MSGPEFDQAAAARLRAICERLGLSSFVPVDDEKLMEAQFAVFGMVRSEIDALFGRKPSKLSNERAGDQPGSAYDLSKSRINRHE